MMPVRNPARAARRLALRTQLCMMSRVRKTSLGLAGGGCVRPLGQVLAPVLPRVARQRSSEAALAQQ